MPVGVPLVWRVGVAMSAVDQPTNQPEPPVPSDVVRRALVPLLLDIVSGNRKKSWGAMAKLCKHSLWSLLVQQEITSAHARTNATLIIQT